MLESGRRLLSERERLNLKAVDVYDELQIHQNTYRNYEKGDRDIPSSFLEKLWHMGFDVMYVVTGVYSDDFVNNGGYQVASPQPQHTVNKRLIELPDEVDLTSPADRLLTAMYHVEDALMQTGAVANTDYDYKALAKIAVGMLDTVK